MNKKLFLTGTIILVFSLISAFNLNLDINSEDNNISGITLNDIDASAGLSEWWNSNVYYCKENICHQNLILYTFDGTYEQCLDGSSVAHCWNCKRCDA